MRKIAKVSRQVFVLRIAALTRKISHEYVILVKMVASYA